MDTFVRICLIMTKHSNWREVMNGRIVFWRLYVVLKDWTAHAYMQCKTHAHTHAGIPWLYIFLSPFFSLLSIYEWKRHAYTHTRLLHSTSFGFKLADTNTCTQTRLHTKSVDIHRVCMYERIFTSCELRRKEHIHTYTQTRLHKKNFDTHVDYMFVGEKIFTAWANVSLSLQQRTNCQEKVYFIIIAIFGVSVWIWARCRTFRKSNVVKNFLNTFDTFLNLNLRCVSNL